VVKYPGRVHDSFIWNNCGLKLYFDNNNMNGWLLGYSGYPLEKNSMTLFLNPQTNGQMRYNDSHIQTRNVIERVWTVDDLRPSYTWNKCNKCCHWYTTPPAAMGAGQSVERRIHSLNIFYLWNA